MRLIRAKALVQTREIAFVELFSDIPKYAILSHTWDGTQEVTFQHCNSASSKLKTGYDKIRKTCELALKDGIEYIWVDTCCIDKSSSAELTEAINSMFRWYQQAAVCYVYLADFADLSEISALKHCRWFSRGWTLQELIAPKSMKFFNQSWTYFGSKDSLMDQLSSITSIDAMILGHEAPLSSACIAKRLSWAAGRKTTRVEDKAYCLLGICDINMPMLYGEGQASFRRLQEEIIKSTCDLSLLAWTPEKDSKEEFLGFLAESVDDFASCSDMYSLTDSLLDEREMNISNKSLKLRTPVVVISSDIHIQYALELNQTNPSCPAGFLTIPMRKIGPNTFVRARSVRGRNEDNKPEMLAPFCLEPATWTEIQASDITLLTQLPRPTIQTISAWAGNSSMVSSIRHTVVQIELPSGISLDLIHTTPTKFWDLEDRVFFGPHSRSQNWAAVALHYQALFVCFWYRKETKWIFKGTFLNPKDEEEMDELWKILFVFAERFGYEHDITEQVIERFQQGEESVGSSRFSFTVRKEKNPHICSGPRWKVGFKRELLNET
ncbi:hypothetical protein F53441_13216 [Fusarium austroafricanum]|uniref:Heterokaryon incompatibility domain-containing protein n=1 Tax=Fusarium austroafricanum TaxID=2364996 RepID=A0A8H4NKP4_9HYPO|nr:hypothetical protein F53441_13216 [Fusarium austroafricanum]